MVHLAEGLTEIRTQIASRCGLLGAQQWESVESALRQWTERTGIAVSGRITHWDSDTRTFEIADRAGRLATSELGQPGLSAGCGWVIDLTDIEPGKIAGKVLVEEASLGNRGFKITQNAPEGYSVSTGEVALGSGHLRTSGMDTCIALGIEGSEINLLAHVTATSDAKVLAGVINDTFGSEEGLVIKVWNYGPKGNPISGSTRSVIDESLSQLQVAHQIHVVIEHTNFMTDTAEVGA